MRLRPLALLAASPAAAVQGFSDRYIRYLNARDASFCRITQFDKRGIGLSDRSGIGSLEDRMDDFRAVMDAVGLERAAVFGVSEGGSLAILFAGTYPERVSPVTGEGTS